MACTAYICLRCSNHQKNGWQCDKCGWPRLRMEWDEENVTPAREERARYDNEP